MRRSPARGQVSARGGAPYEPPAGVVAVALEDLIAGARSIDPQQQFRLATGTGRPLYCAGDTSLLRGRAVAVVGSRSASEAGRARARRLASELAEAGVVVVSGLAKGIDTAAHVGALQAGGRTCAVIGTPLERAYPAENRRLQEQLCREHLVVSPFPPGSPVTPGSFPERNKIMAALSDATVIIEASDTSGTLHQAAECVRLGRALLVPRSLAESGLEWVGKFVKRGAVVFASTREVLAAIGVGAPPP